jgi:hypothetical protein
LKTGKDRHSFSLMERFENSLAILLAVGIAALIAGILVAGA